MVAIFMRLLKECKGILILTTDRVHTFYEAFMCRINLAVPFPALVKKQPIQLWHNLLWKSKD
jgi:hypothetical protein